MTADIQTLSAKLDLVLAEVRAMRRTGKPGYTQRQFAKAINVSPRTVGRMVAEKRIVTKNRRIPASEVDRFLS